jgi:hypothetical protein
MARLVATGFFRRFREVELVPAGETVTRLLARLRDASPLRVARLRVDGRPVESIDDCLDLPQEAGRVLLSAVTQLAGIPVSLRVAAFSVHGRGRAGLVIDLVSAPPPTEVRVRLDRAAGAGAKGVAGLVREQLELDRKGWGGVVADLRQQGEKLLDALAVLCRESVGVEQIERHLAIGAPTVPAVELLAGPVTAPAPPLQQPGQRLTGMAGLWLQALSDVATAQPELFHALGPVSIDGGGLFESGPAADGGGLHDAGDGSDVGGGAF